MGSNLMLLRLPIESTYDFTSSYSMPDCFSNVDLRPGVSPSILMLMFSCALRKSRLMYGFVIFLVELYFVSA